MLNKLAFLPHYDAECLCMWGSNLGLSELGKVHGRNLFGLLDLLLEVSQLKGKRKKTYSSTS